MGQSSRLGADFFVFIQTKSPYGHPDIKMDIFKVMGSTTILAQRSTDI